MVEKNGYLPGTFCWFELATSDQEAAKSFYAGLFGWTPNDTPMGPGSFYTMLQLRGKEIGALYTMMPDVKAMGVPPNWMTYVAVADVDASAAKVKELGGAVMAAPMDVFDFGRMVVAKDPQGAVFAMWQARSHKGAGLYGETGAACWAELQTKGIDGAKAFYGGLFGWEGKTSAGGGVAYTEWQMPGTGPFGGGMEIQPDMGPIPPNWLVYFMVDDVDASVAKAAELGAKTCVPPMDIPGTGRFSVLADPQGAVFAVFKLTAAS